MDLSAVPVWRVFENLWVNQIVGMLTLAPGIWAGFVLIGWWGVPASVAVHFGAWQLLVWRLWIRRGRPREANRFTLSWRPSPSLKNGLEWFGAALLLCAIAAWEGLFVPGIFRGIFGGEAYNGEPLSAGERGGYLLGFFLLGVLPAGGWLCLVVVRKTSRGRPRGSGPQQ